MKKIIGLLTVITGIALLFSGCGMAKNTNNANTNSYKPVSTTNTNKQSANMNVDKINTNTNDNNNKNDANNNTNTNLEASIDIQNLTFEPATITVKKGSTVTWFNKDSVSHQIKSSFFNSAAFNPGQSVSYTFLTAGTYTYSCAIHPSMTGTIIVQ